MSPSKKHGLGKGIGALMDDYSFDTVYETAVAHSLPDASSPESAKGLLVQEIEIERLHPNPNQPRKTFDGETLEELAESIRNQGILQPLLVERISDKDYSIIAGERRYRAAKLAGLAAVPVIVKDFTNQQRLEVSLVENIQRENLNAIEEAQAYAYLIKDAGIRQEDLAQRVGKNRTTITNSLRLLQLPPVFKEAVAKGRLSAGHARALLSVVNPADQEILYRRVIEQELSVREAERLASDFNYGKRLSRPGKGPSRGDALPMKSADILAIENKFLEVTGVRVEVKGSIEKGKIEITYQSQEELERIYALISPEHDLFEI
ncbi:ParB/RepB/Spo0J family partition protein [Parasphaerochaeta coccoides]|uniref:ParB-like partition protein n=1 Tax=Parasphaerochaeta coccoides (strain ATCC BAA-1237 / DSM 17374 / SPN1) TaxID=760011 RepID=F4GM84_PARC1|nr:ParB/RepB/Spo0J family partition protein [Parasphaerochaeta coccoides]AEC03060.1 parB-like partition protein [Parasphaerochaeta coccoides DSM 17374]